MQHKTVITSAFLLGGTVVLIACQAQVTNTPNKAVQAESTAAMADTTQLSAYIVATLEDSKGNLWFGTVGDGVIRYSPQPSVVPGERLTYFTTKDGLADMVSSSIVEDKQGHIWIGSHDGATRYDGTTFTAFKTAEGLHGPGCVLLVDRNGTLWAGTNDGAFRFDGATKYDGTAFTHFTKEDGLCSNNVASITEDVEGNLWFGCITSDFPPIQEGGVARYDGKTFTQFADEKGLTANDVYTVYAQRSGHVWIAAVGVGAYRYTPPSLLRADRLPFTLFDVTDRPDLIQNFGVQSILEDRKGTLWFGFSGGLFRFNGTGFEHVTRSGPWEAR